MNCSRVYVNTTTLLDVKSGNNKPGPQTRATGFLTGLLLLFEIFFVIDLSVCYCTEVLSNLTLLISIMVACKETLNLLPSFSSRG